MAYNPSGGGYPIIQPSSSNESFTRPPPSSRISSVSDLSSPDFYEPDIRGQDAGNFISPQASQSNLQSHQCDTYGRDDSNVSHVQISAVPGSPLDQPRPFSAAFVRMPESRPRGPPLSQTAASNRSRFPWGQTDRYEPVSPVDPSSTGRSANNGLSGRLRSIRSIGSYASRHLSKHSSIPEGDEMDMSLIGNASGYGVGGAVYGRIEEENEREEGIGTLGVDLTSFTGPETSHDVATVLKFRELEQQGHLTGGLGSGLKPDITIRSKDLLSPTSPLEVSRGLSRRTSRRETVLGRELSRRDIGQREANKTGKIIEVLVDDGAEGSGQVDISVYAAEGTPPVEFDPLRNRQPTLKPAKEIYYPQPNWKPHSMRWPYLTALITVSIALAVAQEILYQKSRSLASQDPPSGLFQFTDAQDLSTWDYFSFKYLPTMIAVIYGILWQVTDYEVKRLEPFHRLSKEGGALAAESINVDYITIFNIFRPLRALRYRHWAVAVSSFATILAVSIVPTLQTASIVLEPDRDTRMKDPGGPKYINIYATWSRVLTVVLGLISVMGFLLLIMLQWRRSGLAGDVRGIAGIAVMATKSHVLMDFKDLDTLPPRDIHNKLKHRRYTLRNSSLASDDAGSTNNEDLDKYDRFRLSPNPHPLMLRLSAGVPFIVSMIAFTIFIPLVIFSPANVILEKAGWLLTLFAISIKIGFQTLEQDARLMEPFYRLSCRHAPPKVLTLDYTSMAFGYMPIRAAMNGDFLIALVGFGSVLAEIMTVCIVSLAAVNPGLSPSMINSTQSSTETPRSFWVSFTLSILILFYLIIIASFVYKLRRHPFLPRQPSTIASVLAFIHQSKMLWDFVAVPAQNSSVRPALRTHSITSPTSPDSAIEPPNPRPSRTNTGNSVASDAPLNPPPLRHGVEIHAAQTQGDQDFLVKRLTEMGKTYGLGWFIGRDGETHCGVDQEELKLPYTHQMSRDARMATMNAPGNWEYL